MEVSKLRNPPPFPIGSVTLRFYCTLEAVFAYYWIGLIATQVTGTGLKVCMQAYI